MAPDFGNPRKWLEEKLKLRDSVSTFGAGAVGDGQCWADHQVPSISSLKCRN